MHTLQRSLFETYSPVITLESCSLTEISRRPAKKKIRENDKMTILSNVTQNTRKLPISKLLQNFFVEFGTCQRIAKLAQDSNRKDSKRIIKRTREKFTIIRKIENCTNKERSKFSSKLKKYTTQYIHISSFLSTCRRI